MKKICEVLPEVKNLTLVNGLRVSEVLRSETKWSKIWQRDLAEAIASIQIYPVIGSCGAFLCKYFLF